MRTVLWLAARLVNSMAAGGEVAAVADRLQQQAADIRKGIDAADQ